MLKIRPELHEKSTKPDLHKNNLWVALLGCVFIPLPKLARFGKFSLLLAYKNHGYYCAYMKKNIRAIKPNTSLVPQPRSFGRLVKQMFASVLKYQDPEVMQRLLDLESKIEMMTRALALRAGRGKQAAKVDGTGKN